jgi:hypothetical protein
MAAMARDIISSISEFNPDYMKLKARTDDILKKLDEVRDPLDVNTLKDEYVELTRELSHFPETLIAKQTVTSIKGVGFGKS